MGVLPKDASSKTEKKNLHKGLKTIYLSDAITVSYWSKATIFLSTNSNHKFMWSFIGNREGPYKYASFWKG